MSSRKLGPFSVSPIGFGCMSLSHAYGVPPSPHEGAKVLERALDVGYTFLDTAALYGFGANETLVGDTLSHRRSEYVLASKCGIGKNAEGKREINGSPEAIKATCEDSLRRLKTDVIDLYYLHRWDKRVPIEDSVGALKDLVEAGKIKTIGLSEVSADTLRRAHAVHPVTALQTEYSLWTRNPEVAVLDACRELGVAFVAFSPVGRGFLAGGVPDAAALPDGDIRRTMPRFQGEAFLSNLQLLEGLSAIAQETQSTVAQLCLAWLLAKDEIIIPIPGTARIDHLEENAAAERLALSADVSARLEALINPKTVAGARYNPATQAEIDTEELA
jgi:aryl-alcohol dehydrogenase-like predicted oxidoreductase